MKLIASLSASSNYKPKGGDQQRLFEMLVEQDLSRPEAIQSFPNANYFNLTYKRLKDNLLAHISKKDLADLELQYYEVQHKAMAANLLFYNNNRAAIKIAEEVIVQAERLDLLQIALSLSNKLELHYSIIDINSRKFKKYKEKTIYLSKIYREECRARSILASFNFELYKKRKSFDINTIEQELLSYSNNQHYRFKMFYHTTLSLIYKHRQDRTNELKNYEEAIQFFKNNQLIYISEWKFTKELAKLYLEEKSYKLAASKINKALLLPPEGCFNWHLSMQQKAVLGFHTQKLALVLSTQKKALQHPPTSSIIKGQWLLIGAWLAIFEKLDKIQTGTSFRLYRFQNEVELPPIQRPVLLIVEGIYLLLQKKKKQFLLWKEKTATISIPKTHHARTKVMLQMLYKIESCDYHPISVQRHTAPLLKKMQKLPIPVEIEFVPYEWLWELVMEWLRK